MKVASATDYHPFGLEMPGRKENSTAYRYGFNGKEKDQNGEWGSQTVYDYGFRIYNPAIAKFLSVDPLTKSYPWYTPYQFAGNKPIIAIDLDGLEEHVVISAQKNADPTGADSRRGYDNKFISNSGEKIANGLGYNHRLMTTGESLVQIFKDATLQEGLIQAVVINGHGSSTGVFGAWNAGLYSDGVAPGGDSNNFFPGNASVSDIENGMEGGWFEDPSIKFSNSAVVCFLTCRAGKENVADDGDNLTFAEQLTLKTGVTTIAASGGVNRNKTGSPYIYKTFAQKKENDTEGAWYKFERVAKPFKIFGITLYNSYEVKKTRLKNDRDTDSVKYFDVRDYVPINE